MTTGMPEADVVVAGVLAMVVFFIGLGLASWAVKEIYLAYWAAHDWVADRLNKLNKGEL